MANRGMSAAMLSEIAGQKIRIFHLLELYFSTVGYLTTARRNIVWNGNTYHALGNWLSFGEVEESTEIRSGTMNVTLSGVNQANIQMALTENFIERSVIVRRGFLNATDQIVIDPLVIFDGRVDSWSLTEDVVQGTSTIVWQAASHWIDFDRTYGRRCNSEDQQIFFPGDRFFEFAAQTDEIRWGRV